MSGDAGHNPTLIFLEQQRRADVAALIEEYLSRIDPALVGGVLSTRGLPSGTLVERGEWSTDAIYRKGDLVFTTDGRTYVATAMSASIEPPDTDYWRLIGGGIVPAPFVYLLDSDGFYLVDSDGAYLYEYL